MSEEYLYDKNAIVDCIFYKETVRDFSEDKKRRIREKIRLLTENDAENQEMIERIMKEKVCSVAKVSMPNCSRKLKVYEIKGKTFYFCDRRGMIDESGNPYQKPLPELFTDGKAL